MQFSQSRCLRTSAGQWTISAQALWAAAAQEARVCKAYKQPAHLGAVARRSVTSWLVKGCLSDWLAASIKAHRLEAENFGVGCLQAEVQTGNSGARASSRLADPMPSPT